MNEARQVIRYVFPGLVASAVFLLLWLFAVPGHGELPEVLRVEGEGLGQLSTLVGAVLASGAIGYLASQVYFCVHWIFDPVDHSRAASTILERKSPGGGQRRGRGESENEANSPSHSSARGLSQAREDWVTLTVWWFMTRGVDPRIDKSTSRTTSLMDHAHSSGILAWAILLSTVAWLWSAAFATDASCITWCTGLCVVAALELVLFYNARNTRRMFEELVDQMVDRAIHTKSEDLTAYRPPCQHR